MRIHMNLTRENATAVLRTACERSGAKFTRFSWHDSRTHMVAAEVRLSGEAGRRTNSGRHGSGGHEAASWDQRGIFLSTIYEVDPSSKTGEYMNSQDFHYTTGSRFDADGIHDRDHPDYKKTPHRWVFNVETFDYTCGGHGPKEARVSCEARMPR